MTLPLWPWWTERDGHLLLRSSRSRRATAGQNPVHQGRIPRVPAGCLHHTVRLNDLDVRYFETTLTGGWEEAKRQRGQSREIRKQQAFGGSRSQGTEEVGLVQT